MTAVEARERVREEIARAKRVVFFGGAGVSTESGIPDFRSKDGLYHQKYDYPPETILSHDFFLQKPEAFYKFYYEKIADVKASPNRTHKALARLEEEGKLIAVVTQNIDGLHYAAGSKTVYELHGSAMRNNCMRCGAFYTLEEILAKKPLPTCSKCGALIKPDVTLYGEIPPEDAFDGALAAVRSSDLLIVGGTSLAVYPAAGIINYRGGRLLVINRDPTPADAHADLAVTGFSIGDILG